MASANIYSDKEVATVVARAAKLRSRYGLEAQGISLKAFGNWQAKFKAEPHGVFLWPSNVEPGGTLALARGSCRG
jgi:hypothetical protein